MEEPCIEEIVALLLNFDTSLIDFVSQDNDNKRKDLLMIKDFLLR